VKNGADSIIAGTVSNFQKLEFNYNGKANIGELDTTVRGSSNATAVEIDVKGYNVIFAGDIKGEGGIDKKGNGKLTLEGSATYTGPTTITGTLSFFAQGQDTAQILTGPIGGAGTLEKNGPGTLTLGGSDISVNTIAINEGALIFKRDTAQTLSSTIGGDGKLEKTGAGTLALEGNNTYKGGTTITGGLIEFRNENNFGGGTDPKNITLNGGGLKWAKNFEGSDKDISDKLTDIGAGGGIFDTNGNDVGFGSGLTGDGGIVKTGPGTLTLEGGNTYTGPTTIAAGTLTVTGTLGSGGHYAEEIANAGTLIFNQTENQTLTGLIHGPGALQKAGDGTLKLTAANTYEGGATITGGLIEFDRPENFGGTDRNITLNGGGLKWAEGNTTNISGRLADIGENGGIFDTNGNSITLEALTGRGGLTKIGPGTLTLEGDNTYTGLTAIKAGTLGLTGTLASAVTLAPGATLNAHPGGHIGGDLAAREANLNINLPFFDPNANTVHLENIRIIGRQS
jgi:autotransporter-associated beta strand protein